MESALGLLSKIFLAVPLLAAKRMYHEARDTWNPYVGCLHDCLYCKKSFQRQVARVGRIFGCEGCIRYQPHFHPERLSRRLPRTGPGQFIFACDCGDWTFARPEWRAAVLRRIAELPDRTFLIQSKNPACFQKDSFPPNVILGTTIETNRDELGRAISKAPPPSARYAAMATLRWPRKMVTVEPIMDFDPDTLLRWVKDISPLCVYVGYDSRLTGLPEPPRAKTEAFMAAVEEAGIPVRRKLIREAQPSRPGLRG